MKSIREEKTDVLIVGSGGAGLRCAIELHDKKVDCIVVGKCKQRDAHTILATGGINAALGTFDPEDSWQLHAADTIKDGGMLNDAKAVELLCKNAPDAVRELQKWGAQFHKEKNGRMTQRFFGAATYRRACFSGDQTGLAILNTLVRQTLKRKITFQSNIYIFSLLKNKGKVNGALGIDMVKGELVRYHSKIVVLCTGGHSRMFKRSSSRFWENTGDGIYLASKAGAEFMDMELFQFHPTGMVWPLEHAGTLVTEAVRGEGGILTNSKGERFMKKYDPLRMDLSARDIVAISIFKEVQAGRATKHGGVWLDISHKPKSYILNRLPKMFRQLKTFAGVDISISKMEVGPTAHYSMGGIKIDHSTGRTKVPGLYAIGEVTSGVHGGNRLGGNSLAEIIVFGKLTGKSIVRALRSTTWTPLDEKQVYAESTRLMDRFHVTRGIDPVVEKKKLQELMWRHVGVVRNGAGLKKGLKALERCRGMKMKVSGGLKMNEKLIAALDVQNMVVASEMIIKAASFRKETRRAHIRTDYPKTLKKWEKNIVVSVVKGKVQLRTSRVTLASKEIMKLIDHDDELEDHHLE
ncbi:MAG: FAD-binding protein [Nanoarchaeota archaeon]|nr:FAD-binding protein [Nanoarchaeota archaeon]